MTRDLDVNTLTTEQRTTLFIALLEADPSLPKALTTQQRRQLYAVLIDIEPSIAPLPDARSAVLGVTNEQVGTFVFY
jgi:hypothetical protein